MENLIKMDDLGVPLFFGNTHRGPMSLHLSDMVAAKTSLSQASDAICDSPNWS